MNALLEAIMGPTATESEAAVSRRTKAFAWARVSTDMQEERGQSIPEQLRQIRDYAHRNGIEIVEEFHEAASAFRKESARIEFNRMIERVKVDKAVSVILVHDYSRFSRDSLKARMLIRELKQHGVAVVSLNDVVVDPETVAGVYMEAITFAKNEAYSREVAFHTKKGCRANVQTRDPETGWCYKNGGQPLFGYRSERFQRGEEKKGRPLIKCIWVPDETIVAGRPAHEWARHCLVELAGKGATLDQLRDFCNDNGIPAPRQQYWGSTTWHSLLDTHCLLQFAGYGVWNVRGKTRRVNPASEWVIVENAHPALITEDEAKMILEVRQGRSFGTPKGRSMSRARASSYLLSGGLFVCGRCGANMLGFRNSEKGIYYVCGSMPYRRGMGCGPGVYVPKMQIEQEVVSGLRDLIGTCSDPRGFTNQVNQELRRIWEDAVGYDPNISARLSELDSKIANIRRAVEDGLPDSDWAFARMRELVAERERLANQPAITGSAPQIDVDTAMSYRRNLERVFVTGDQTERKLLLGTWVDKIKLAPETLEVEITYRIPEPVMNDMGAGTLSVNLHQ